MATFKLGKSDGAIIIRGDGKREILMPKSDDDAPATATQMRLFALVAIEAEPFRDLYEMLAKRLTDFAEQHG